MESAIFELNFHLRKPYNEAETLIDTFNHIIEEGGRCEICISPIPTGGCILQIKMYRCKNTYSATSLGAKIIDNFSKDDFLKITKFNFASIYYSPVRFTLKSGNESGNDIHGPIISVTLFENENPDIQNNINQHFKLIDLASN